MRLVAKVQFPGTGCLALLEFTILIGLKMFLSGKRSLPSGFICFLAFQTITTLVDATISFRLRRPDFCNTFSEDTMSFKLVFVIVLAADFMALLIFSLARFDALSSYAILKGIAAGAAAAILPIRIPFVRTFSR